MKSRTAFEPFEDAGEPLCASFQVEKMSKEIVSNGMCWNMLERGHGDRTLVFLPGTLGSVEIFKEQVQAFSEHSRVIVLGYPGTSDLDRLSDSFWSILQTLAVNEPHLIGSSLGAFLLQHFTSQSANGAQCLVLGNTFVNSHRLRFLRTFDPKFIDQASPSQTKKTWLDFVESLASSKLRSTLLPMVRDQQTDAELYGRSLAIAHFGPVRLSTVAPERISILSCADDPVCGEEVTAEVITSYPLGRHIRLASGAHYPHVMNPVEYNAAVLAAFS